MSVKDGIVLGKRYEVLSKVGAGGMADVYKGKDRMLNRYVAIKVLKKEYKEDENFVRKFRSEAQAAAGLMHPNIVNVYDVGEDRGLYYMVMELVEGITLKEYIEKKGRLSHKEVISIAIQMCTGLGVAHAADIIHRDIKPQNIIISKDGKVKVTDFGIAKATTSNTVSSNAMGSVHYTSPEQARGGFSDQRSDIYSVGITLFEMVTGQVPFDGDSTVSVAIKHLQEEIMSPSELVPDIPYSLEQIILKCTQKNSERRYRNTDELIQDMKRSLVDPDGAAPQLCAVKDDIVSLGTYGTRIAVNQMPVLLHRHGEGMVHRHKTPLLLRIFQKRELGHPQEFKIIFLQQIHLPCQLQTQIAQHIPDHLVLVCRKQQQIPWLSVHGCCQPVHLFLSHEFGKGGFARSVRLNRHIGQASGSEALGKLYQGINLLSGHTSLALGINSAHSTAALQRSFKHCELTVLNHIRHIDKLHVKTQIRFV